MLPMCAAFPFSWSRCAIVAITGKRVLTFSRSAEREAVWPENRNQSGDIHQPTRWLHDDADTVPETEKVRVHCKLRLMRTR